MPLISSNTIVTSVSFFHLTLAFIFLTSPSTINNQALVYVLGESMGMPYARGFENPSSPLAFLACVLAMMGFSDLISLSMPEEVTALYYWGTQAPLRLTFASLTLIYSLLFSSSQPPLADTVSPPSPRFPPSYSEGMGMGVGGGGGGGGGGDGLRNRVTFTFMFVEMISWFWLWTTLRDERPAVVERIRRAKLREG